MEIKILSEAFDPWQQIQLHQQAEKKIAGKYGATSVFVGTMRDFNEGDEVKGMLLEHYPGMTEKQLQKIIRTAMQKWQVLDVLVVHRVGELFPDQPIVLVAVWSSHRGDACDVNRYILEALKSDVPFWKKELLLTDSQRWLQKNSDGYKK